ncbi:hypothetical protein ACET3Z_015241 [Daucus carota]
MNGHHDKNDSDNIWTCEVDKLLEELRENQFGDEWTFEDNKLVDDLQGNVEVLESSNKGSKDLANEDGGGPSEKKKMTKRLRARPIQWTQKEHKLFLLGLQKLGKGKWKEMSKFYVQTKTPAQITSHAQKFYKRIDNPTPLDKRKHSINDIRFVEDFSSLTDIQPNILSPQSSMPQNHVHHTIEHPVLNNINHHPNILQNFVPLNYNQSSITSPQSIVPQNYIPHAIQHQVLNSFGSQPTVTQNHALPNFQQMAHNRMQQPILFPENN